jgi:hypothetical protein
VHHRESNGTSKGQHHAKAFTYSVNQRSQKLYPGSGMEECIIMDKERTEDIPGGGALVLLILYFFKIWHFSSERAMIFSYQYGDKLRLL